MRIIFKILSRGRFVLNFKSLSFFVWPGRLLRTNPCIIVNKSNYPSHSSRGFWQFFWVLELYFGCLIPSLDLKCKFHRAWKIISTFWTQDWILWLMIYRYNAPPSKYIQFNSFFKLKQSRFYVSMGVCLIVLTKRGKNRLRIV